MGIAYIKEFESMPYMQNAGGGANTQIWPEPGLDQTPVTYTTPAESAAFSVKTKYIAITSDSVFSYVVGTTPVATTSNFRVPAGEILVFAVPSPASSYKISFVANT